MIKPYKFEIYELVDRVTYERFGEKAWWFRSPRSMTVLSWLRINYGRAWVNNWKWGGRFQYRGLRPPAYVQRVEASKRDKYRSLHLLGCADDITFEKYSAKQIRDEIRSMDKKEEVYPLIGAIEKKVPWLHIDTRPQLDGKILWVNP